MTIHTDNKDFYPTPQALFYRLMDGLRYIDGRVLEPSAGKGDMIKHMIGLNRYIGANVDAIENDPRLVLTLMGEGYNVVWDDFLTYETYKEYDFIVMNPPFSNGVDHVLKAIELAESQLTHCAIYAILNKKTIDNAYSNKRQTLLRKLDEHGAKIEYVSDGFTQAERKTDVEVALIRISVEKEGAGRSIYDTLPLHASQDKTEEALGTALSTYVKHNEVADRLNDIERLILEYEQACELAKSTYVALRNKASFYAYIGNVNTREGEYGNPLAHVIANEKEYRADDLNAEIDRLRSVYWSLILDADEFRQMLTNEARQKLNRQMESANAMEINLANIRMLLTAIGANKRDMLIESVVSIFEKITRYHMNEYSTNIHYYDGWKTNDAYKIGRKIIIPIARGGYSGWDIKEEYSRINYQTREWVGDIVKAFQLIDPSVNNDFEYIGDNSFSNGLLRFRMFLNGNIHVWFNNVRLLAQLNYLCGSHFGWIPSEGEQKESAKAREWVAEEFGDMGEVILLQEAII